MAIIRLLHGWGYDASLWREVIPRLPGQQVEALELGFFGATKSALAERRMPQGQTVTIAVGHSLGALLWLTTTDADWDALVIINGFPKFTAAADYPGGVPPRVLERMQKRFAENPAAVLADFQRACGAPGPRLPADPRPLAEGLDYLAQADGRGRLEQRAGDCHLLASRDDAIVSPAMSEAAFVRLPAGQRRVCDDGGHALPLTRPEDCATLILEVAARFAER